MPRKYKSYKVEIKSNGLKFIYTHNGEISKSKPCIKMKKFGLGKIMKKEDLSIVTQKEQNGKFD